DSLETQRLLSQNNELLRENSVMVANSRQWEKDLHSVYEQLKAKTKELASAKEVSYSLYPLCGYTCRVYAGLDSLAGSMQ
ncbi:hypothetical protein SARC_17488, partial [Sphaeroforma arctica JP610]